jgi:hypothetical protein
MSWPSLPGPHPPPPPRTSVNTHLLVAAGIGLAFGLFVYFARAPIPRVIGAGAVMAVGSFGLLRAMEVGRLEWPARPHGRAIRAAGLQRWRLNGFEAMTDQRPGLSPDLRNRLRALAAAILTRHQLESGSPAAMALLGRDTHELLFPPARGDDDPRPEDPTNEQLSALTDRLIELADTRRRIAPDGSATPDRTALEVPRPASRSPLEGTR